MDISEGKNRGMANSLLQRDDLTDTEKLAVPVNPL